MWITLVTIFLFVFVAAYCNILLYNTETNDAVDKFDCVYYVNDNGEDIPYCQRPDGYQKIEREKKTCENEGEVKQFHELLEHGINPSEILHWSSSVEMADMYASIFYNHSLINDGDDKFLCKCTKMGTFGKYCEYQLTHDTSSFSEAIMRQFQHKKNDLWNTQRYGQILCYKTLSCNSNKLCYDWRDICDGTQQCSSGIDEENWDKLEFNECEDNEFRCSNGMCIQKEFWLDGNYDCMDWSDEIMLDNYNGDSCPFEPNAMECDEHICRRDSYSCGDGQCIHWLFRMAFQRVVPLLDDNCFTKRHLNYMCEVSWHRRAWTLQNGLCWPDEGYNDTQYPPWDMMNSSNLSNEEKCQYLFRCILSSNFELDCPCNHHNCTQLMMNICSSNDYLILYPPEGLINPNLAFYYNYSHSLENLNVNVMKFSGNLKCRGYYFTSHKKIEEKFSILRALNPRIYHLLCTSHSSNFGHQDFVSSLQFDKFCWNESLTFNGRPYAVNPNVCGDTGECISQYRIHDGEEDCFNTEDEEMVFNINYCTGNVGQHRFQCFNDEYKCLILSAMGTGKNQCSNKYDEMWYGNGLSLSKMSSCLKTETTDCGRLKEYIVQSTIRNISSYISFVNTEQEKSSSEMYFRFYCNSFWDLYQHTDELPSSCKYWMCSPDEYQCQTGQCIDFNWVCDGEWDCADASDEEAIMLINQWSNHNSKLFSLNPQHEICRQKYSLSPFYRICNTTYQFGCYRSGVLDPLDFQLNPPCINLTQIGDGVEDCYNAYDEKNTFHVYIGSETMLGFHLRCGNDVLPYISAFYGAGSLYKNCTKFLHSNDRNKDGSCSNPKDVICLLDNHCMENKRCDGEPHCYYGEDEYWCAPGSIKNQYNYRSDKELTKPIRNFTLPYYPSEDVIMSHSQNISSSIINSRNDSFFIPHSYQCNRGVAVLHINETICLCPPAYYGRFCEYFSDRISIIAHVDLKTLLLKTISNITLKIRANFLFTNTIIDYHEFNIIPTIENIKKIKHKFYLLYSRSAHMLAHKQKRYFNRTDIINNHPYSVHFDIFSLENNGSIREFGSWHYLIYFDYLPAFRLAVILRFPSWLGNDTLNPCYENLCNINSICVPIFNQNNSYYCSCKNDYYGKDCDIYESRCDTYCTVGAFCRRNDNLQTKTNYVYCICPLDRFGPHCNLKYDVCNSKPCLNNGICLPTYNLSAEITYMCICSNLFYGNQCENGKATIHINLNMTNIFSTRATVVQFYDIITPGRLLIRQQQVYQDLPSIIHYDHDDIYAPTLGLLKIYIDLSKPLYFMMCLLKQSVINITASPRSCPHALSLLPKNTDPSVPAIFKYHHICENDTQRLCFYDENYFCICQSHGNGVECFIHDIQSDHCDNCISGGKCVQGDLNNPNNYICLCPSCHQGSRCEFNMQAFGFTLDSLLIDHSNGVKIIYIILAFLFFIIGLFNNFCSFATFKRSIPRKFGVGNYLFIVTCLNQTNLLCLLFKFIQITFEISNIGSCKAISYLLSVSTRLIYWLISWVTINRLLIVLFPISLAPKNTRLAIIISIITSIILFGIHIHEIISYTIIQSFPTNSSICVTNFDTNIVSIYNQVSTLIHHLLPFFIQVVSITLLIILAARSRIKTASENLTIRQIINKQFQLQKELYITPMIIVISALPQTILTFSLACIELTNWQRHALLGVYLFSQIPQVLGFILYVLPSTTYKKEFYQTSIAKKYLKWIFDNK